MWEFDRYMEKGFRDGSIGWGVYGMDRHWVRDGRIIAAMAQGHLGLGFFGYSSHTAVFTME